MKCPECKSGFLAIINKKIPFVKCSICKGTGKLPDDIYYMPKVGQALKLERLSTKKTLRQYCKEKHLNPCLRSERERGYFRIDKNIEELNGQERKKR